MPKPLAAKQKAMRLVEFALEKKAKNPLILDVRHLSGICDYFVICSAETSKQTKAIYEEVLKKCERNKIDVNHSEADQLCEWILVDLFDVILHIFVDEARDFYDLEYLWKMAKKVGVKK